ncbi:hypothetical protein MLD38_003641 [Melastoma candidum]|uniref:Uncharacterized protein n=1 Tax=Melastoma candidum TaxID=119954 RepID=A0ACB9S395_9MYRT|nr:hypothetical protein MLD38_003641 [Melastoma candidum]
MESTNPAPTIPNATPSDGPPAVNPHAYLDPPEDSGEDFAPPLPVPTDEPLLSQSDRLNSLSRKLQSEPVSIRVHDVIIKGNAKTKDWVIEAELDNIRDVDTLQELIRAATVANFRLEQLGIFQSVNIVLDAGPKELPGTANVVVNVVEATNPVSGEVGYYTKTDAGSSTLEGALKFKNLLGYGDLWDASFAYGFNQSSELSAGLFLPRLKSFLTPLTARVFLLSKDWLQFSSYNERSLGLSVGLVSTMNHDLVYDLGWRTLADPSQGSSRSVRRQLGHDLISSLKYTFKFDRRDSALRPTKGFAFHSTSQVGGLTPDSRSLRSVRQELDLRYAIPLGFGRAALNFGVAGGVVLPLKNGFLANPTSLPERFFLGGNRSPFYSFGGPTSLLGFRTRGVGPSDLRRQNPDSDSDPERDFIGGDLAFTAFADLSFDLPFNWCRGSGIYGHVFGCAGNLARLSQNEYKNFSFQDFLKTYRSTVGVGIVMPTNIVRLELNYCHVMRQFSYDKRKAGFQVSISST